MNTYMADTHSLLWYISNSPLLSSEAKHIFDQAEEGNAAVMVSAITLIEVIYLAEKKKIPSERMKALIDKIENSTNYLVAPVTFEVAIAIRDVSREKVPDMPDRIIVATARSAHCKLITKDKSIRICGAIETIW
jgi:PIN domain nuclease of toxin-antitoxin system